MVPAAESRQLPGREGVAEGRQRGTQQQGGSRGSTHGYPGTVFGRYWGKFSAKPAGRATRTELASVLQAASKIR